MTSIIPLNLFHCLDTLVVTVPKKERNNIVNDERKPMNLANFIKFDTRIDLHDITKDFWFSLSSIKIDFCDDSSKRISSSSSLTHSVNNDYFSDRINNSPIREKIDCFANGVMKIHEKNANDNNKRRGLSKSMTSFKEVFPAKLSVTFTPQPRSSSQKRNRFSSSKSLSLLHHRPEKNISGEHGSWL